MGKHLSRDLEDLGQELVRIGDLVRRAISRATVALAERRLEEARAVIDGDEEIDQLEVWIENECLKILALHQPVAADLRYVVTVLKVNNDLERMGDLAVNIAKRARALADEPSLDSVLNVTELQERVNGMVGESLRCLIERDSKRAREVLKADEAVDELHKAHYETVQRLIQDAPPTAGRAIQMLSVSRYLERISDLSTNIAEDVIFLVEGEIIRHNVQAL